MRYQFLYLVINLLMHVCWTNANKSCTRYLAALAQPQQEFVHCATINSVPVHLCVKCQRFYEHMGKAYEDLANNPNCSKQYFDKDRINIVATTQNILIGLWNKAYCDDCFIGNHTFTFDDKNSRLQGCLATKKNVCTECMLDYEDLNSFYIQLDQQNHGKICYDLQDSINSTRLDWSNKYKCCQRVFDMTLFMVTSILVLCLPFLFYGTLYSVGKYRERNHGLLNAVTDLETVGMPSDAQSSSSRQHIVSGDTIPKSLPRSLDDDDSDDDDCDPKTS